MTDPPVIHMMSILLGFRNYVLIPTSSILPRRQFHNGDFFLDLVNDGVL